MGYLYSQLDKDNIRWFENNNACNTLKSISVTNGNIRGIFPMNIRFEYPITAIVGENGSGKSTLLSLVACAFHNESEYFPPDRYRVNAKKPRNYYTFGDFFTFAPNEPGIGGIQIQYEILTNAGRATDIRKKKPSGKWNDYKTRKKRVVVYLGLNRILPPSESNPHKHYKRQFLEPLLTENQTMQLAESMSRIFDRVYGRIQLYQHNAYRLFDVTKDGASYSGFNMGAGENAVLSLLAEIMLAGSGSLFVIDEIELSLHAQAQKKLIDELKNICFTRKIQIICSTHSEIILENLPPEGRWFIRHSGDITDVFPKVTPKFAFGKLAGANTRELDVFVEDSIGELFLEGILPRSIRERIKIHCIGSDQAIIKQIAAQYRLRRYNFIAFFDGDKRSQRQSAITRIKDHLETRLDHDDDVFREMMLQRLQYLPGNSWPEYEIMEILKSADPLLLAPWEIEKDDIFRIFSCAQAAGKHSEFYYLNKNLHLPIEQIQGDAIRFYRVLQEEETSGLKDIIESIFKTL